MLSYLVKRFPYLDEIGWQARLDQGALSLDGQIAYAQSPIRPGLTLTYRFEGWEEPELPSSAQVLARQGDLAFVHKPAGLPVHKTGKIIFQTLAHWVHRELGEDFTPLNRLDRETSGVVAFARGPEAFRRFAPEFGSSWLKVYLAVVRGVLKVDSGRCEGALGEKAGDVIRSRMHVDDMGKPSLTLWRNLGPVPKIEDAAIGNFSLIAAAPITGRKHQIRAHLSHLGLPIVGDKMYAHEGQFYLKRLTQELTLEDEGQLGSPHHLLHAFYLNLNQAGEGLSAFDEIWPEAMKPFLDAEFIQGWRAGPAFSDWKSEILAARQAFKTQVEPAGP